MVGVGVSVCDINVKDTKAFTLPKAMDASIFVAFIRDVRGW